MEKVEEGIWDTIEKTKKDGIDKDSFERAKKVHCGHFMSVLDSVESFGNEYMMAYHKGVNLFEYANVCENLTVEDAKERLSELFDEKQCSVSVVYPKGALKNE